MSYAVTLAGFRPAPRFDGIPWERVRVEEAAAQSGPWAPLETVELVPVDANPEEPAVRNVTTDQATLAEGWYRLVFLDAASVENPSDPIFSGSASGFSVAEVRGASELLQDLYPADPFDAAAEAELEAKITTAVALIESLVCGRVLGDLTGNDRWIALRAVVLKTEQLAVRGATKQRRRAIRSGNLRSISAGPWSESYFGPEEAAKAKRLDPDPELHEVLWALADEDCRESWLVLWGGQPKPAAAVQSFDYRRLPGGYGLERDWG